MSTAFNYMSYLSDINKIFRIIKETCYEKKEVQQLRDDVDKITHEYEAMKMEAKEAQAALQKRNEACDSIVFESQKKNEILEKQVMELYERLLQAKKSIENGLQIDSNVFRKAGPSQGLGFVPYPQMAEGSYSQRPNNFPPPYTMQMSGRYPNSGDNMNAGNVRGPFYDDNRFLRDQVNPTPFNMCGAYPNHVFPQNFSYNNLGTVDQSPLHLGAMHGLCSKLDGLDCNVERNLAPPEFSARKTTSWKSNLKKEEQDHIDNGKGKTNGTKQRIHNNFKQKNIQHDRVLKNPNQNAFMKMNRGQNQNSMKYDGRNNSESQGNRYPNNVKKQANKISSTKRQEKSKKREPQSDLIRKFLKGEIPSEVEALCHGIDPHEEVSGVILTTGTKFSIPKTVKDILVFKEDNPDATLILDNTSI